MINDLKRQTWEFWAPAVLTVLWTFLLIGNLALIISGGELFFSLFLSAVAVFFIILDVNDAVEAWRDEE